MTNTRPTLHAPLTEIPANFVSVADYEAYAKTMLPAASWAYLHSGAADEMTCRRNLDVFRETTLSPRAMVDLDGGHTALTLFGHTYAHPVFAAPVAYQRLAHQDGELATVLAASAMQAGMVVSALSSVSLEDIAREAHHPLWFQLYLQPDRAFTVSLVKRAEAAGYKALVVTIDAPVTGVRNVEQRAGFVLPSHIAPVNLQGMQSTPGFVARPGESAVFQSPQVRTAPTWRDITWLAGQTTLPVLVKGVLSAHDARQAIAAGAAGIIVSNHGGRVLDTTPATLDVLPEIVQAVGGDVPVLMDGGIRRGTDIIKALALGARAVLIGRPLVYGLACAGAPGVAHILHILRTELEIAMALCGRKTLNDIDRSVLWQRSQ